jgi:hypothetical protein
MCTRGRPHCSPDSKNPCSRGRQGQRWRCGGRYGEEAEDLSDFAGLLRASHSRAVDEGRLGGMGRRQQSFPSGCGEGEPRSGCHRRDHGEAGRRPQRSVGSDGPFGEHAELPKNLGEDGRKKPARKPAAKTKQSSAQPDKAADRKAAQAYERERQRREREEARRPGRRGAHAGRRPSTRRKRRWARRRGSTRNAWLRCVPKSRPSRRRYRPRRRIGTRKRNG